MKLLGKHLTVDMYGCRFENLNDLEFIKNAMTSAITEANMTLLDFTSYQFEPHGLTAIALLAESHMSMHTYPEYGYAAVDIFTCGDQSRPERAVKVLKRFLKPDKTKTTHIKRGDFASVRDMKPKVKVGIAPLRRVRNTGIRMLRFFAKRK